MKHFGIHLVFNLYGFTEWCSKLKNKLVRFVRLRQRCKRKMMAVPPPVFLLPPPSQIWASLSNRQPPPLPFIHSISSFNPSPASITPPSPPDLRCQTLDFNLSRIPPLTSPLLTFGGGGLWWWEGTASPARLSRASLSSPRPSLSCLGAFRRVFIFNVLDVFLSPLWMFYFFLFSGFAGTTFIRMNEAKINENPCMRGYLSTGARNKICSRAKNIVKSQV